MKTLLKKLVMDLSLVLASILFGIGSIELRLEWLKLIAPVPLAAAAVIKLFFWRCPHCGNDFGRRYPGRRCPKCDRLLP